MKPPRPPFNAADCLKELQRINQQLATATLVERRRHATAARKAARKR